MAIASPDQNNIQVFDYSSVQNPSLVATATIIDATTRSINLFNNLLAICSSEGSTQIFEITSQNTISQRATIPSPNILGVKFIENKVVLYGTPYDQALQRYDEILSVYDISNLNTPTLIDSNLSALQSSYGGKGMPLIQIANNRIVTARATVYDYTNRSNAIRVGAIFPEAPFYVYNNYIYSRGRRTTNLAVHSF